MIILYTSNWCGYCNAAKNLLRELHLDFKEINIENENISREELMNLSGGYTVPQIKINETFIKPKHALGFRLTIDTKQDYQLVKNLLSYN